MRHVARFALPLAIATFVASCGERQQQGGAPPPPAVTVAKPVKRTVFDYDEYVGRFTAINSVEVRARVSGYLDKLHFKDGQLVKQGDLLFTIDKRPFQTALDQAQANLAQARANLRQALDRALAVYDVEFEGNQALRYLHRVKDKADVRVRVPGDRELIFGDVRIRVDPNFRLAMHIDTDEANAANLRTGTQGYLDALQSQD